MKRPILKNGAPLGVAPTQAQKLQYIANKLGLDGISKMQGSTVILFDTVLIHSALSRQTLSFFTQTQSKSRTHSNFQNGVLGAGEAMVIETISFHLVRLTHSDLSDNACLISDLRSFNAVPTGGGAIIQSPEGLKHGLINITIANQRVVKDLLAIETDPNYNPKTSGIGSAEIESGTIATKIFGQTTITLESPPVLPPNQKIEISLEIPAISDVTDNWGVVCSIGRFGSIFSSKTTL